MENSLNIVIPVYNEGGNIKLTLSEIKGKIKTPHKIFVIYDFDEDDTIPVVKDFLQTDDEIILVKNKYGAGALNAIKTGFESVNDGVILVLMADLSDDLSAVDEMFNKIKEGYDIVCGSRYMEGGKQIGGPRFKKFLSRIAGISIHYITGIPTHDITNSFKMYHKRIFRDIRIESRGGFELGMEIAAKAFIKGYRIAEVPSKWQERASGKSRFKLFSWLPKYMYWYFYTLKNSLF